MLKVFAHTLYGILSLKYALLVPLMVLDGTGQIATEVIIKVIEKCLEYLLESLSLTLHKHVPESISLVNLTKLPAYLTVKIFKLLGP